MTTRVAIVVLVYNRADVATLCLESLARARTDVPWEVFVIDNASRPAESAAVEGVFRRLHGQGVLAGVFRRSPTNLGFPGGNNAGFRWLLGRGGFSHVCVLNSDVIVTDRWLDRLLAHGAAVIGPVTNACGNEQTVPHQPDAAQPEAAQPGAAQPGAAQPGAAPPVDESAIARAQALAAERWDLFAGATRRTDFLGFFCCVFRIEVLTDVGFLDERFGRGAYEDDDWCLRVLAAGYPMTVARDVFVWHWGTASFGQVPLRRLLWTLARNRRRFERKHGVRWRDRSWLPVLGALQDLEHLAGDGDGDTSTAAAAALAVQHGRRHLEQSAGRRGPWRRLCVRARALLPERPLRWLRRLGGFARALLRRPVVVLARCHPAAAPAGDGYFQRVALIDRELGFEPRLYVRFEGARPGLLLPRVVRHARGSYELHCGPRNVLHALLLLLLTAWSGRVYVHSVLRLHDGAPRWLYRVARRRVLDVHGAVPEEFAYHGDPVGARVHDGYEAFAVGRATALVVVSGAMQDHLQRKHGRLPPAVLRMPMLPRRGLPHVADDGELPRRGVVYCGGLHRWQQLDAMLRYVHAHGDVGFTFLVTDPDAVERRYRELFGVGFPGRAATVAADAVDAEERRHAFGLVLREPNVVNRVACPTKLVEYLGNGLVPIVETLAIGDFDRYDLQAVTLDQPLPDAATRTAMAAANLAVLRRLQADHALGAEALRAHL